MKTLLSTWTALRTSAFLGLILLLAAEALHSAALEPPAAGGVAAVDQALARIQTHRRLLVIAAHPDDESNGLLTLISQGQYGEAAYLSLSRGEGGQNLIGPELGVGLGVLRSRELEAARSIDGAHQFFSRAHDFGYTRSLEETFTRWPREALLEDAVRVIRRFKPQVVVAIFPGDARAGHGQHQASGVIAAEAFRLAGDPNAFPKLSTEGLAPWKATSFYRHAWFLRGNGGSHHLETGQLEPLSGRSIHQIAMASRSQHRSQDMGMLQDIGPRPLELKLEDTLADPSTLESTEGDPFAGTPTQLSGIADLLPAGERQNRVEVHLERASEQAAALRTKLAPSRLAEAAHPLAELLEELEAAYIALGASSGWRGADSHAAELISEKITLAKGALVASSGIVLDAVADREAVALGGTLSVTAKIWNAGSAPVDGLAGQLTANEGSGAWISVPLSLPLASQVAPGELAEATLEFTLADTAAPSTPYFLRKSRQGDLYDWTDTPAQTKGLPYGPVPLRARFQLNLAGRTLQVDREVVYRYRDQAIGEIRRPLYAVPPMEVSVKPDLLVWPSTDRAPRDLEVVVTAHPGQPIEGHVEVSDAPGWRQLETPRFSFSDKGGREVFRLPLVPTQEPANGRHSLSVTAITSDGKRYDQAFPLIDYPHVRPTPRPVAATLEVSVADIQSPGLGLLGYLRGASDRVPEFLADAGIPVELLTMEALLNEELDRFDTIVIGPRAYETQAQLGAAQPRLRAFAEQGGTLIVQYQQYQFVRGAFAAFPLEIARPHDRVTDEGAPVRLLVPDHPVFKRPNVIGPQDWEGWVQERGLYFANTWDSAYTPLLELPGYDGKPLQGGLLVARLGRGWYVYSGLAFFRQLPSGVPGAYRLFFNLLALREDTTYP